MLAAAGIAAKPYWDEWTKSVDCVNPGERIYSAQLHGFTGRPIDACFKQHVKWTDRTVYVPSRCYRKKGTGGSIETWGEVWVKDKTCMPTWSPFKDDGCASLGYRQFSATIKSIPGKADIHKQLDWCNAAQAEVRGVTLHTPNR